MDGAKLPSLINHLVGELNQIDSCHNLWLL